MAIFKGTELTEVSIESAYDDEEQTLWEVKRAVMKWFNKLKDYQASIADKSGDINHNIELRVKAPGLKRTHIVRLLDYLKTLDNSVEETLMDIHIAHHDEHRLMMERNVTFACELGEHLWYEDTILSISMGFKYVYYIMEDDIETQISEEGYNKMLPEFKEGILKSFL